MYVYKYHRFGSAGEVHYASLKEALQHAVNDMESGDAAPLEILNAKHELVFDLDEITTAWQHHYLLDDAG